MSGTTSGTLLRTARERAGLTQTELAGRAGVTQSVISAYESGHREPALPTLAALIDAAGFDLDLRLRRIQRPLDRLSGPLGRRVRQHRHRLIMAAGAHGMTNLRVFGSVARGEDQPGSDVDLLVDIAPGLGLFGLGRARAELEQILHAQIDLVPASDLKPLVAQRVAVDLVAL